MTPPDHSGPDAWTDAVARLDRARHDLDQATDEVKSRPTGTGSEPAASHLMHAEKRVAAQEAWLAWVELGDYR